MKETANIQTVHTVKDTNIAVVAKNDNPGKFAIMVDGQLVTPFEIERYDDSFFGWIGVEAHNKLGLVYLAEAPIYVTPIFDEIKVEPNEPLVFIKEGVKGYFTTDQRFITFNEFNKMTQEEHDDIDFKFLWSDTE